MRRVMSRVRSLWRALWGGERLDAAMSDEMRFHLEMETDRLVRERRLDPHEARRQALLAFGGLEKFKEQGRDTRGLRWLDILSLDARLGVRMLVKYRGLTIVGGFAMAVAIGIGATCFEVFSQMLDPVLPIEDGERVVAIQYATSTPGSAERRIVRDFVEWRQEIKSIEQLGAFRTESHNLVSGSGPHEPILAAEITASGFAVARTAPARGRYLVPDDERAGAAPVIVIGHQAWQSRFGGDPSIVGRSINLGGVVTTVVGVMPEGFRFPLDHQYWIPLRLNPQAYGSLQGPRLFVFGRLVHGVAMETAQAELTTIGQRAAADHPEAYGHLRLVALPYPHEHLGLSTPLRRWLLRLLVLVLGALTFVVSVNLAILFYARTITRLGEIAVRTALGASRRRILAQLFTEALALALVGTAAGLVLARIGLERLQAVALSYGMGVFWIDFQISAPTVLYALALAVLAAAIMGVLPGLKASGGHVGTNLRQLDSRTGVRLGPVWTTLVVAQVAVAVAVLPFALALSWQVLRMGTPRPALTADTIVAAVVATEEERAGQFDLVQQLEAEPGVEGVTFSSDVPGFASGRLFQFVEPLSDRHAAVDVKYPGTALGVDTLDVALDLFATYDAQVVAGREFTNGDLGSARTAIVNEAFVREFLTARRPEDNDSRPVEPGHALGMRFRYRTPYERPGTSAETAYEIVGAVRDFPGFPPEPGSDGEPTIYHAAAADDVKRLVLSVKFATGIPQGFPDRFRTIAGQVDPALQVVRVASLPDFYDQQRSIWRYLASGVGLLVVSVLMLSAAGIYAMISFTVAQRSREIAIRSALGASPERLLMNIFGRAGRQLGTGLAVGSLLAAVVLEGLDVTLGRGAALTGAVACLMLAVGLAAALGPARRGLRIQASEALRADT
jgi:putative ABC transport system permease protein